MTSLSPFRAFLLSLLASLAYKLAVSRLHNAESSTSSLRSAPVAQHFITVNGSLPTLPRPATDFSRALENALETVLKEAEAQVARQLHSELRKRLRGVPGTAIRSEAEAQRLQRYLDCVSGQGRWVRDEEGATIREAVGGVTVHKQTSTFAACDKRYYKSRAAETTGDWDVRDDLKWTWQPDEACNNLLPGALLRTWQAKPRQIADLPSRRSLCQLLRHKNILLIGDAASHYLIHDLLLDWTSDKPLTCYGDLFCNEHGICGGHLAEGATGADDWESDDTVNDRLPPPPGSTSAKLLLQMPAAKQPYASDHPRGTIIRYRRSDGFYLRTSPSMPGHDASFSHPATGVREINNYALADARRSDLVLINKAPLPVPLPDSYYGNWTVKLENARPAERPLLALKLATAMTVDTWLVDLLDSLLELREEQPQPADQLVVYRSSWRTAANCGSTADDSMHGPLANLRLDAGDQEIHTMLHDYQVMLQNHLSRKVVLPRFGIPFLDLETPLSIWQSGTVLGKTPCNCFQPCIPSSGMALERGLIGGLWKVMAWGWAKDQESIGQWMGDAFIPLRERQRQWKRRK